MKKINRSTEYKNLLQHKLCDSEGQTILDPLIKILMLSKDHKLSNIVADINDFKALINLKSHLIDNFMSDCTF